jgi:hypothetical protein
MTPIQRRQAAHTTTVMRFLLDEFVEVADDGCATEDAEKDVVTFQTRAARVLLPGPQKGAFSLQQMTLRTLKPAAFQQLRREVRDWLRSLVMFSSRGHQRTLKGPLTLSLVTVPGKPARLKAPIADGSPLDVFWFYLVHFIAQVGLSQIGVCHAPKSKRDPGQQNPELAGATERCERLFLRRGHAKAYCSERCRARVATQKARKGKG